MSSDKLLKVHAIKNGTVIDHVRSDRALALLRVLRLDGHAGVVTLGVNFKSKKLKYKGLIKVEGKELAPEEVDQIAVLAPQATINIIRDCQVVKKFKVTIPEEIRGVVHCPNPKCVTNAERIESKFHPLLKAGDHYSFKCHYCERSFSGGEIINQH